MAISHGTWLLYPNNNRAMKEYNWTSRYVILLKIQTVLWRVYLISWYNVQFFCPAFQEIQDFLILKVLQVLVDIIILIVHCWNWCYEWSRKDCLGTIKKTYRVSQKRTFRMLLGPQCTGSITICRHPLCLEIDFWSFLNKTKQDQAPSSHVNGKI